MAGTFNFGFETEEGRSFQLGFGEARQKTTAGEPGQIFGFPASKVVLVGALAVGAVVMVMLLK